MNTPRPGLLHESVQTSFATNTDQLTGRPVREARTTRLAMTWAEEGLQIRFEAGRVRDEPATRLQVET